MPEIEFTTKGAEKVEAAQNRLNKGQEKTQRNYQLTAKEAQKLGRIEEQIIKQTETAREKYNRRLDETRKALAGNAREVELLKRAETQLKLELLRSTDANKKRGMEHAAAAKSATAEQKKLTKAVQDTEKAGDGLGTTIFEAFSPTKLAGYAAGFVGVQQVVSLITAELRAQQDMIDKRNAAQLTVGESRNALLRNVIGSTPEQIGGLQSSASHANSTGVSEVAINNALADTISATGDIPLSVKLVERSAQFLKDRPTEIGDFAGALGDFTKVTGSTDPNVQLGLLAQLGPLSRIKSPSLTAKNAAPALIGSLPFGGTAQSAGALFSALTTGTADTTGERSRTATIALAQQLEEASQGKGAFEPSNTQPGFLPGQLQGNNMLERIRFLQNNPKLATLFLDNASFERTGVGAVTQLLTDPKSTMRADFDKALGAIGNTEQLAKIGQEATDIFKFNQLDPVAGRSRALSRTAEGLQTRKASEYLDTKDLENLRTIALESGSSNLGASFTEFLGKAEGGGKFRAVDAIPAIEAQARAFEHPKEFVGGGGMEEGGFMDRPPTRQEAESAKLLRDQIEILKAGLTEQQNMNRKLNEISVGGGIPVGSG